MSSLSHDDSQSSTIIQAHFSSLNLENSNSLLIEWQRHPRLHHPIGSLCVLPLDGQFLLYQLHDHISTRPSIDRTKGENNVKRAIAASLYCLFCSLSVDVIIASTEHRACYWVSVSMPRYQR